MKPDVTREFTDYSAFISILPEVIIIGYHISSVSIVMLKMEMAVLLLLS